MRPPTAPEPPEVPPGDAGAPRPRAGRTPSPDVHVAAELLAAVALGDPPDARDDAHLSTCVRCREDLAGLVALVDVGRAGDEDRPVPPPPGLWDRIAAGAGVPVDPVPPTGLLRAAGPSTRTPSTPTPSTSGASTSAPPPGRSRAPRGAVPRPRRVLPVAAALVVGLVLGAGGLAAIRSGGAAADGGARVVATADLGPLGTAGAGAAGTAVLRGAGADRTLEVDVTGLPAPAGYYELWLLDPAGGLVSLGVVAGGRVLVDLPEDLDLDRYPVVDVSDEPFDGDPAHSADSVLRGSIAL